MAALVLAAPASATAASYASLTAEGPLEHIAISDELNCQVIHTWDAQAQMYPSVDRDHGACGTQLHVGGTTYGPADVPGGNDPADFVPVSQSSITGKGTAAQPYKVVTVVTAGPIRITQTDTYTEGREEYRTDVALKNTATSARPVVLYRFGDCFLHEDDTGYGKVVGSGVACATSPTDPKAGTLTWAPITAGATYYEGAFGPLYDAMAAGAQFPSTCDCANLTENAAGLSWGRTMSAGAVVTYSHTTKLSPVGPDAITISKTVVKPEALAKTPVTYTMVVRNESDAPQTLDELTDLLPPSFSYVTGSTTGITTANPTRRVDGRLAWRLDHAIPARGTATLKFRAIANGSPGSVYYNRAGGSGSIRVAPSGPVAAVRICTIVDGAGGNTIVGTAGNDVICAGDGDDVVDALDGNDLIFGGTGHDDIRGGGGDDSLDGGSDNDRLDGGLGSDLFVGGGNVDTVFYGPGVVSQLLIDLNNNGERDGATGERDDVRDDIENAVGGDGADNIIGNSLANLLQGGAGGDTIAGKGAIDQLRGGAGYDQLKGNDDSAADSLDCETDLGRATPGNNDTTVNCDLS